MTDTRNIEDHYKYWTDDAIRASLDAKRFPFIVACENFEYDFNIATAIRNANAFTAKEIWIVGRRKWDRRGAVGVQNYEHIKKFADWDEVLNSIEADENGEYPYFVAFENIDGAEDIRTFDWPEKCVMIFGQESIGISDRAKEISDHIVYIPQFGSTRSLNVGTASGIAMYSYVQDWGY